MKYTKPLRADIGNWSKQSRMRYGWPLDASDWSALPIDVITNKGWRSVTMGRRVSSAVPLRPGIYLMCSPCLTPSPRSGPFDHLYEALYVGESDNLRRRFIEHLTVPSPKVKAARLCYAATIRFWYLLLELERVKIVESFLISCLGPPANDRPGIDVATAITLDPVPA